ncbi:MAG: GtrA family protein [Clostridiales bacterium]|nr:GtrA family protein [Clostridiales bacterium]
METKDKDIINKEETTAPQKGRSLVQLLKFALVGASNTLVDMLVNTGVSFLLRLLFSGSWITYVAKGIGYACGILNSYLLNSGWTFKEERSRDKREVISFIAVNLIVLGISFGLIFLFKNVFGLNTWWEGLALPAWLKKIVGGDLFCSLLSTVICLPVNFILNKLFVFVGKKGKETK